MANNVALPPPPKNPDSLYNWLNSVHYKVSNKNHQIITSASGVNLDANFVQLKTSDATYAIELDAPTLAGVLKVIEMTERTGAFNVTMSLANCIGTTPSTTCTWNGTRQYLVMISAFDKWLIINSYGVTLT